MFDSILDHMEKGYSKDSVAGMLRISRDTLYRWIKEYPDFSDTIKLGEELSRVWWEKQAIDNITHYKDGKQLNYSGIGASVPGKLQSVSAYTHPVRRSMRTAK